MESKLLRGCQIAGMVVIFIWTILNKYIPEFFDGMLLGGEIAICVIFFIGLKLEKDKKNDI